ncbi:MAG: adenylosuccinate synthase [Gammaproteobacteria bacterium]|nr:adenylosuccinate synthase [Gammaproteobacteria bacterium]
MKLKQNTVIVGAQWGDEGKGKIVDWLTAMADGVVRFHGGHNAGHTLVIDGVKTALQIIPSGIMQKHAHCYIGNGVVLSGVQLLSEIAKLEQAGLEVHTRLHISASCTLVLPYHVALDRARDQRQKIGTTGKGISPAYEDKVARRAVRLQDLFDPVALNAKITQNVEYYNYLLAYYDHPSIPLEIVLTEIATYRDLLMGLSCDVSIALDQANREGKRLIFEGAQGVLLDIDHGTYPFVTSSHCVSASAAIGSGLAPSQIPASLGVVKAYNTRVGEGPFLTELTTQEPGAGYHLASIGHEKGTVTGRPRRCGWLDLPLLRRSVLLNGFSGLVLTKIDVLSGLPEIAVCTHYTHQGKLLNIAPNQAHILADCQPVYTYFPGWTADIRGIKQWEQLPTACQNYIQYIEGSVNCPVVIISTGAERADTMIITDSFLCAPHKLNY